ncbi:Uncharacterised protein (plasmid) [Tsukamurella tyrosinosolvens]|uniref:Uncharacterized protein n=1 Tax=Tsukamurella tyrosinosolvens TaxID=57704 RepID=A0A1H4VGV0_TSUTY|nr:hypothetical protein [Tsukamurella tyrosinosolvens]KXO90994.1 hypothetical protein AXK58_21425 [Tsukamurella tyrosinosolvens]SEC79614.1 hypothetical protein SAMN04489793_3208 [Tsukamurella tyrosinosolvens]VEH90558.1 Uncharacterised protein [Tsukamurella tyrosinosolvens]
MSDQLYAAKAETGTTLGYVRAETAEDARDFFSSGAGQGLGGVAAVVRANHTGPHTPNPGGCPDGCVS